MIQKPRLVMRQLRNLGTACLVAVGMMAVLNACMAPSTPPDPYAAYRPAMRPTQQHQLDDLGPAPRYNIEIELDPSTDLLLGVADVDLENSSPDAWSYLMFRLYPMLEQYGGNIRIQSVAVNGQPASFIYQAENTAMRVNLASPLLPGKRASVHITWKLEIPTWSDESNIYALFGKSQEMISLPLFYPSLAVYQPGPTRNTGEWWTDVGSVRGDAAFNNASLFVVTATLPSDEIPVTSGTLISSTLLGRNRARHVWVTGPAREFVLHSSAQFSSAYTETNGTRVTSYWLPGDEAAGKAALNYAVSALRVYNDRFEPYPFRDIRVAPAPLSFRGMEYPQVNLLGIEVYDRARDTMEVLVAHEVAHQWWYQTVHNDPVNSPWLDEALAEYSVKLYIEALRGVSDAETFQYSRWELPLEIIKELGLETEIDRSVNSFETGRQYETIVYGKGALFYDALRNTLGDRRFNDFLQQYLDDHRYQIVTSDDWLEAITALGNPMLEELFRGWVAQQGARTPQRTGQGSPTTSP